MGEKGMFTKGSFGIALALAMFCFSCSCSRPGVVPAGSSQSELHDAALQAEDGSNEGSELPPAPTISSAKSAALRDAELVGVEHLPPGTLLVVRLKRPVYASASPETHFEAVVDQPVVVGGNTLIPKGASVAGRVESAQTSRIKPNRGYVRLALQSVSVGDRRVPVQTASLFAHEAPLGDAPISVIHLEKGRRLTFRLIESEEASAEPMPAGR